MAKRGQYGAPTGMHAESAVPLILIAILAVFLAGKFGIIPLEGIPILNQIVPPSDVGILIFGKDPALFQLLGSAEFQGIGGINARPVPYPIEDNSQYLVKSSNIKIIILSGEQYCPPAFRKAVADRVRAGASLMVIGDACTKVRGDATVIGWNVGINSLGSIMPVEIGGLTTRRQPIVTYDATGTFRIVDPNHPIYGSGPSGGQKDFAFSEEVTEVTPKANSEILGQIDTGYGNRNLYAVIEGKSFPAGKVMYFAFNPAKTPTPILVRNTLLYLSNKQG